MRLARSILVKSRAAESADGSIKYVFRLRDGNKIETVYIPQPDGAVKACISSQVGCVNKCAYCATGARNYIRDLASEEIVAQGSAVLEVHMSRISKSTSLGILFMGMGEPFLNYANVMSAVRKFEGGECGPVDSIIISTSGVVPGMQSFSREATTAKLAVSINAPNDEIRSQLMPINRFYPLSDVLRACCEYTERQGRPVILEYILLEGVNDAPAHAEQFAKVALSFRSEVHVIPFNGFRRAMYRKPGENSIGHFCTALNELGVDVALKPSYGIDVLGGCGQLGGHR